MKNARDGERSEWRAEKKRVRERERESGSEPDNVKRICWSADIGKTVPLP